jgi:hypothetical protein
MSKRFGWGFLFLAVWILLIAALEWGDDRGEAIVWAFLGLVLVFQGVRVLRGSDFYG